MSELTIILDALNHKELKEYLESLKGILNVSIKNEKYLEIHVKYNPDLITPIIIKGEILLFLKCFKIPSIVSFDKHSLIETSNYNIVVKDLCCEYCFKGIIDDLFEIEGIEKVESNFEDGACFRNVTIKVHYNAEVISIDDIKKIESNINEII